jgi:hypothetical protein
MSSSARNSWSCFHLLRHKMKSKQRRAVTALKDSAVVMYVGLCMSTRNEPLVLMGQFVWIVLYYVYLSAGKYSVLSNFSLCCPAREPLCTVTWKNVFISYKSRCLNWRSSSVIFLFSFFHVHFWTWLSSVIVCLQRLYTIRPATRCKSVNARHILRTFCISIPIGW